MLNKLSGPVLILGSRIVDLNDENREVDDNLATLFPYNIEIRPPEDATHLVSWTSQLEEDMKKIQVQDNKNHILEVLAANDLVCDDLDAICLGDTVALSNYIEEIVVSAISHYLMNNKDHDYRNGKLVISSKRLAEKCFVIAGQTFVPPSLTIIYIYSLSHGLMTFRESNSSSKSAVQIESRAETKVSTFSVIHIPIKMAAN